MKKLLSKNRSYLVFSLLESFDISFLEFPVYQKKKTDRTEPNGDKNRGWLLFCLVRKYTVFSQATCLNLTLKPCVMFNDDNNNNFNKNIMLILS